MQGIQNNTGSLSATLSEMKQSNVSSFRMQESKGRKTGKKKLNYNHREVSSQLMRAGKKQNACQALARANGKLAMLQRCKSSGEYNEKEVTDAIAHARKIVRCAQIKVRHLKEEEQMLERSKREKEEKKFEKMQMELMERKRRNRDKEDGDIKNVDMEYQREQIKDLGIHQETNVIQPQMPQPLTPQSTVPENGVVLELSTPPPTL